MNTLHLSHMRALLPPKIIWMRINRLLAWALIVSPPLQWALGTSFYGGLQLDLAILLAHAVMSLALFGAPKMKTRAFSVPMHLFGIRPEGLSERNWFLLSGYRILLLVLVLFSILIAALAVWSWRDDWAWLWSVQLLLMLLSFIPLMFTPVALVQHVHGGVRAALKRWGMRGGASDMATLIVVFYALLSFINLAK